MSVDDETDDIVAVSKTAGPNEMLKVSNLFHIVIKFIIFCNMNCKD